MLGEWRKINLVCAKCGEPCYYYKGAGTKCKRCGHTQFSPATKNLLLDNKERKV